MKYNERQRVGFGISIFCAVLAVVAVAFRFWARAIKQARFRASDYTIAISAVFMIGYVSTDLYGNAHGAGRSTSELSPKDLEELVKYLTNYKRKAAVVSTIPWALSIVPSKLAIVLLYLEIFISRPFRTACWITFGVIVAYGLMTIIVLAASCMPYDYQWNRTIPGGHCVDITAFTIADLTMNILLDVVLFLLPQPVIWRLQMHFKQKLAVSLAFSLGIGTIVISIFREVYNAPQPSSSDRAINNWDTNLFGTLETTMSIIVACVPTIQPAFALLGHKLKMYVMSDYASSTSGRKSRPWSSENRRTSFRDSSSIQKPLRLYLHSPFSMSSGGGSGAKAKASGGNQAPLSHESGKGAFRRLPGDEEISLTSYPPEGRSVESGQSDVIGVRKEFGVYEERASPGRMV